MSSLPVVTSFNSLSIFQKQQLRVLFFALGGIFTAFFLNASSDGISLFGIVLPTMCPFRLFTGLDCPGCGLTRATLLALSGHFQESYFLHLCGIPLAAWIVFQIPYRFFQLITNRYLNFNLPSAVQKWQSPALILSLLVPWAMKTVAVLAVRFS